MKHLPLVVSALIFILSCNPYGKDEISLKNKLDKIDKSLYENSTNAIYSLKAIDTSNISERNKAYPKFPKIYVSPNYFYTKS